VSTIWRAISRKHGWVVHFSNHRDLNAFLFSNGASNYEVDRLEYSRKVDIIKMLNGSALQGWMNGRGRKSDISKEVTKEK
jgi:hypothetical protein